MLKCLFPSLLNQLFRVWKKSGGTIRHRRNIDEDDVQQILKYIETYYAAASLKEAAERFGYHPDYLSRLIKRRLGHTFSDIKHRICIDKAKFLLLGSDLTIQQVAEHVGFSNMSFFYEIFDRYCGTTPARYREDFGQEKLPL
jgi:YesN/AraC family two-component response regulator